jgi:gluconolactonase
MSTDPVPEPRETIGRIERDGSALDSLIAPQARIEKLADGFTWSEGPVWIREGRYLLLSDVPANRMYRWSERDGLSVFLEPSGHASIAPAGFREPGSNGLVRGPGNSILMADHGNRAVARLDLATRTKTFLATHHEGRRFNSPNDLVQGRDGSIYFTDPPYGLDGLNASPLKEIAYNGVYRIAPGGGVELLEKGMSFPNGIVLSRDERTLYVANSDPERAVIMAFDLGAGGRLTRGRVFADPGPPRRDGGGHGRQFVRHGPGRRSRLHPRGRKAGADRHRHRDRKLRLRRGRKDFISYI